MLPTAAELDRIRADIEAATFPDTCNILSLTQTSDGMGGYTETWGTVLTSVSCRLDLTKTGGVGIYGIGEVKAASYQAFKTWVLSCPYDTSITSANRVECNGLTFNVTEVDNGISWHAAMRVTLEKV